MARRSIVLGAGMVGVSIAWHLAKRGHEVTLVDRREPGKETSFGNAGIIQREAVRPYAFPRDMKTLLGVLPNRRVDIRYRPGGMIHAASPLLRYWLNSAPKVYQRIVPEYASLIQLCLDTHAPMIEAAGAESLIKKQGFLELFRSQSSLDKSLKEATENKERFGVAFHHLDRTSLAVKEPDISDEIVGAIHWLDPWTVTDPGALVAAYAEAFKASGGRVLQSEVSNLSQGDDATWNVQTENETLQADDVVVALGPWSGRWLKPLGYHFPTFVKRGYHMHYGSQGKAHLNHWIMDADVGYLLAPMRDGIRLTTGAELEDLEAPAHVAQLACAEKAARDLFPLGERRDKVPWKGARPCLPDMKPVISPAPKHKGLWLAFGHGHQGFTLGPATGQLLADMMEEQPTAIDVAPFKANRF
ncbi:NAD(P)/FAD-dependent oxidoreductase [Halomonas llamarensis]|uniref:FAD-binding oxidoreductase n=1 Tax=Halomonas llamarensis TaxID=2945104 RepID=A0ABT0SS98_9GAMM|nr:FAD-dependent oxidoreductase [Halomonas llamarensis]MCL7930350.1 FAD-binding oxidoreductase [Halomonas llamarensis]